jgi:flagellar protein FlaG
MRVGDSNQDIESRVQTRSAPAERVSAAIAAIAADQVRVTQQQARPAQQSQPAQVPELPKMESVTKQIDSFLRSTNRSLQFRVDDATGRTVVSICDAETGEVIRQVPGEEVLKMAQRLQDTVGALLDEKV